MKFIFPIGVSSYLKEENSLFETPSYFLMDDKGEIIIAPDRILISQEFLDNAPKTMLVRDGNLVVIRGKKITMVCYELQYQSPNKLSWEAKLIKKEGL